METVIHAPGLDGVVVGESAICQIDERRGSLRYRGYAIEDLAEQATFEEVSFLLLRGDLPSLRELQEWQAELVHAGSLPTVVGQFLQTVPASAHLMDVLRTGVSFLGMIDPEAHDVSYEANLRKAVRLLAQMPLLLSWAVRTRFDHPLFQAPATKSFAQSLLYLLTGNLRADHAKELEVSLNLYAEHELNASTFAARVTASTLADLYGAVTAAIATLKGPLHGGANEAVAEMFQAIQDPGKAQGWVHSKLTGKERVMGFGHRVLKHEDPRSAIIKRRAKALSQHADEMRWYEIAEIIEQTMKEEKGLLPNLDFYTAVVYLLIGIPKEAFTPIFVASRMSGWCAHIIEQQDHNRLIRPRAFYIGPPSREFLFIGDR
ncbi:MAG TPA: citrate/2-methylcitrate synthase [Nitrospirales bacterium]|nr:citrate/2-methylcitrate synthase [Nitrospirales bacterium]